MKTELQGFRCLLGALSLVALVASGCGELPDAVGSEKESEGPAIEKKVSALTIGCQAAFRHGGDDAFRRDTKVTLPCGVSPFLSPGFHRTTATVVNTGAGACTFAEWLSPNDPRINQVNANVTNAGGFRTGICTLTVFQERDCTHSLCSTGAPLQTNCSADASSICTADPFCCSTFWDGLCVQRVTNAGLSCGP